MCVCMLTYTHIFNELVCLKMHFCEAFCIFCHENKPLHIYSYKWQNISAQDAMQFSRVTEFVSPNLLLSVLFVGFWCCWFVFFYVCTLKEHICKSSSPLSSIHKANVLPPGIHLFGSFWLQSYSFPRVCINMESILLTALRKVVDVWRYFMNVIIVPLWAALVRVQVLLLLMLQLGLFFFVFLFVCKFCIPFLFHSIFHSSHLLIESTIDELC